MEHSDTEKSFSGEDPSANKMPDARNVERVCIDVLTEALNKPITTPKQSYYLLEKLALCFVSVARDVSSISHEVYGNGIPGGLKAQVQQLMNNQKSIESKQDSIEDKLDLIRTELFNERLRVSNREQSQDNKLENLANETARKDTFNVVVKWFADKVLPGIVSFIVTIVITAISILIAMSSGWVIVTLP